MTAQAPGIDLDERVAELEGRLLDAMTPTLRRLDAHEARLSRLEGKEAASAAPLLSGGTVCPEQTALFGRLQYPPTPTAVDAGASNQAEAGGFAWRPAAGLGLGDLVGGRVLAWLGGAATLLGIVLFLVLAVSHGWVGHSARVAFAAGASLALLAAGAWLHERRGRTEAARVMVGTAIAGLFASVVVAGDIYHVLPALVALVAALAVGALATALAIRWAGRAIAALGIVGALLAPVLVGAPRNDVAIALLAVAASAAMAVVLWRRWGWLALAAVLVCLPQWAAWALDGQPALLDALALAFFTMLGLAGGIGAQLRCGGTRLSRTATVSILVSTVATAAIGRVALAQVAGADVGELWLGALAAAHLAVALIGAQRGWLPVPLRRLLLALGVILADVAFGLGAGGITLVLGWGAGALAFALLARRARGDRAEELFLDAGIGAHIGLVLMRALVAAPPETLAVGRGWLALASLATLAAACLACGRLAGEPRSALRLTLDLLGFLAIAWLTATQVGGAALVVAWACEGAVLIELGSRREDALARYAGMAFLAAASLHATIAEAPPVALVSGSRDLGACALALGAVVLASLRAARASAKEPMQRRSLIAGAAASALYLASVATITVFQPAGVADGGTFLALSIRQEGQVALSALLSLVGLAALVTGLRRDSAVVRNAGLSILLLTVAKVFLFDLSMLTEGYRVASFIVLGLLLLAGAFAYQRLRPPALPDLRTVDPAQR